MRAFARGFASAFDIGLRSAPVPKRGVEATGEDADARAIEGDWRRVGDALRHAIAEVADERAERNGKKTGT